MLKHLTGQCVYDFTIKNENTCLYFPCLKKLSEKTNRSEENRQVKNGELREVVVGGGKESFNKLMRTWLTNKAYPHRMDGKLKTSTEICSFV